MSTRRDIPLDQRLTRVAVAGGSRVDAADQRVNWLGHRIGSKADTIDRMLVEGVTADRLMRARRTPEAVKQHLKHLAEEHGLSCRQRPNGLLVFALD